MDVFQDPVELSKQLLIVLDCLGYGAQQRKFRQDAYKAINDKYFPSSKITVGRKGEGISNVYESDRDYLIISSTCLCSEELSYKDEWNRCVFFMKRDYSPPGHTLLTKAWQENSVKLDSCICNSVIQSDFGHPVLSSTLYRHAVHEFLQRQTDFTRGTFIESRNGPATRVTNGVLRQDNVFAMELYCPSLLQTWSLRIRKYDWPPPEVIETIKNMPAYAVPVGCPGSIYQNHEWRICFNIGEMKLVESLTDLQIKLYVLLKMILKEVIRPKQKELSSFMMKNIVFWMSELNHKVLFTDESLVQWLFHALHLLEKSMELNFLPYYMIPERNLFTGKFKDKKRIQLLVKISFIRRSGPRILSRCIRLSRGLSCLRIDSGLFFDFSERRNEIEMLLLQVKYVSDKNMELFDIKNEISHDDRIMIWERIHDLIWPGWRTDYDFGVYGEELVRKYLNGILS